MFSGRVLSPSAACLCVAAAALALSPAPALCDGECWCDAYNALARMVNSRSEATGQPMALEKQPGAAVTQSDLNSIRSLAVSLMQGLFLVPPEGAALAQKNRADAFGVGLRWSGGRLVEPSLMSGIGSNGYFTAAPPECTVSGAGVYANSFTDVPLLWVHFDELHRALLRCRYTRETYYAEWLNDGTPNGRLASWVTNTSWQAATAEADRRYLATAPWLTSGSPSAMAMGRYFAGSGRREAQRSTVTGYARVWNLPSSRPHRVWFYAYAMSGLVSGGTYLITRFDAGGAEGQVAENRWTRWEQTGPTENTSVRSAGMLGSGAWPLWGPESELWSDLRRGTGWAIDGKPAAVIEWTELTDTAVENPAQDDAEDDGLAISACGECNECLPQARADWRSMLASPQVKWPLGVSSGTGSGGLRVKAYVTEFSLGGQPRQMFSLDTRVTRKSGGGGQWEFATVRRPGGAEVVFTLKGGRAGRPVNVARSYRMGADATGCEVRFANGVTHRFDAAGALCSVRKRMGNAEASVSGSSSAWPGMQVARSGGQVSSVTSLLIAEPAWSGGLITDVRYRKLDGSVLRDLALRAGSRRFVRSDAAGKVLDELRVVSSPGGGTAELWQGVITAAGGEATSAAKELREEAYDAEAGTLTVVQRRVLDPDGPGARSNATLTVFENVAGNWEPVRQVEGWGGADGQATRWQYYTNAADGGALGRVRLVERADGTWERYAYDALGRVVKAVAPFGSAGPEAGEEQCRVRRSVYRGDPELAAAGFPAGDVAWPDDSRPRLVVEQALGIEVSRTYRAYLPDRAATRRCAAAGAGYGHAANIETVSFCHTNGAFAGRPYAVAQAGGAVNAYGYGCDAGTLRLTVTNRAGAGAGQAVTSGVETVTVYDPAERALSARTRDIASGALLSAVQYTRDAVGRITCASNVVDGSFETTVHGCYGPLRVTDAEGIVSTNAYDLLRQVRCAQRLGVRTVYGRGVDGEVESTAMTAGGATIQSRAAYDAAGRLVEVTDETGGVTRYAHGTNAAGERVESVTRPDGGTEEYVYHRDGRVRSVTGTGVSPRCYEYGVDADGEYELERMGEDAGAAEWVKRYTDMLGRQWKTVYADGYTVVTLFDAAGRVVRSSDGSTTALAEHSPDGRRGRQAMDMDGDGVMDLAGGDRISESVASYRVEAGRGVSESAEMWYAEEGSGAAQTVSVTRASADGAETWWESFGRTGRMVVVRDRAAVSRTETVILPDGAREARSYSNGLLRTVERQDAAGGTVRRRSYSYDAFGRLSAVTETAANGGERVTRAGYDAAGRPTNVTVVAGGLTRGTSFEYDSMGRVVRAVEPDGGVVERTYGLRGELLSQSGARTYPVSFTYDAQGRLLTLSTYRQGPSGPADTTTWSYDPRRGWPVSKRYPDGSVMSVSSAPNGLPLTRTSARGIETRYSYDAAGSLTNITYSDNTPPVSFTLDRLGRPAGVRDGEGAWANVYAPDGVLSNQVAPCGWSVSEAGDAAGRRAGLTVSAPGGGAGLIAVAYDYDSAGRLCSVRSGDRAVSYAFGPDGVTWTSAVHSAGGSGILRTLRAFDALDRLASIHSLTSDLRPLPSFSYTYNAAGQRTNVALADGSSWGYEYDGMGQLTLAAKQGPGAVNWRYAYDAAGNRTEACGAEGESEYTVNSVNQYTRVETSGVEAAPARGTVFSFDGAVAAVPAGRSARAMTLAYDADGNLVSDGTWAYGWDAENRLVSVSNAAVLVAFTYDHLGRLARKTVARSATPGTLHTLIYDGWNLLAELTHSQTHTLTNLYVWGPDLSGALQGAGGIGGLLCVNQGRASSPSEPLFPCHDASGNVIALSSTSGVIVASYEYGPFGEPISATGPAASANPFRFSTKYTDPDTGLLYYGYRHYSPSLGRWLSRDPIGEEGGINLQAFVGNDPLNAVDPLGQQWWNPNDPDFIPSASIRVAARGVHGVTTGLRVAGGIVPSVLSGDIFDESNIQTTFEPGQCEFLITINGIANRPERAIEMRDEAARRFGLAATRVVNNTHAFVLGDVIQILGHEVGLIDVTSRRAARQIREAYMWAEQEGCKCTRIVVLAHSQGTMVFQRAIPLIPADVRSTIEYHGDGGEAFIAPDAGLRSTDNNWNITEGKGVDLFGLRVPYSEIVRGVDPVPLIGTFANPLKLFGVPYLLSGGRVDIIRTGVDSVGQQPVRGNDHTWISFYNWQY